MSKDDWRSCLLGALVFIVEGVAGSLSPAVAHPTNLLLCGQLVRAQEISASVRSNGMYSERYDTNADGVVDLETLSTVTLTNPDGTVEHAHHPTFYIRDLDYNRSPDLVLVDKGDGGKCDDIVPYQDLNTPAPSKGMQADPDGRSF